VTFALGSRVLSQATLPYLVAEIGVHHENSAQKARDLIAAAAAAGADAVKFQAYRADWLSTPDAPPYWDTSKTPAANQWAMFKASEALPTAEYAALAQYATECGVDFLVTAFDPFLVDELDPLVPAWKIASGDITHRTLVEHIASKGKPVLLSTGASTLREIDTALTWLADVPVALLHCVLAYPTLARHANLLAIPVLADRFDRTVGWSDHVVDGDVVPTAYALGARIIEKHFTLDRAQAGGDHYHSWTPETLAQTVAEIRALQPILGTGEKTVQQCETAARRGARRALHEVDGEPRWLRPAF